MRACDLMASPTPTRALPALMTLALLGTPACGDDPATDAAATADSGGFGGVHFGDGSIGGTADGGAPAAGDAGAKRTGDGGVSDGGGGEGGGDAGAAVGELGAPCEGPADCDSGFCVQGEDGKVCTKVCVETCPAGWNCAQANLGSGDTTWICLPQAPFFCTPCMSSSACNHPGQTGNLCVPLGTTGSFCGVGCNPALPAPCPGGGKCQAVKDPDTGAPAHQCLPADGVCTCSTLAKKRGAQTTCTRDNFYGQCQGTRSCTAGGLSDCDAATPAEEVCDGVDNDCDGQTDEMQVQPLPCQVSNAFGACGGTAKACVGGAVLCDAPEPAQEVCNKLDDDCDGQTDEGLCDDGDPCTSGSCNPDGSCKQLPAAGAGCDDGDACTSVDQCVAGKCVGGSPKTCDDKNPCTKDACDPLVGCTAAPLSGPCADDGDPCTLDLCAAGQCGHPTGNDGAPCADDGKPCTDDVCNQGACSHPAAPKGKACADDGKPCTDDVCDGAFACKHPPKSDVCTIGGACVAAGDKKPGAPCLGCNPKVSATQWVQMSGAACDDGDPCTLKDTCLGAKCAGQAVDCTGLSGACGTGKCLGGKCTVVPKPSGTGCDDGDACTVKDACSGGKCKGKPKSCAQLDSACAAGVCSGGSCVAKPKNSGGSCGDGDLCTINDTCVAGKCKGKPKSCGSLSDACNTGACSGGACVKKPKPNGTWCSDGDPCTGYDKCASGKCVGKPKKDSYEPNDWAPGKKLATKSDCNGPSSLYASISPKGETDWYHFSAKDESFCTIKPSASISYMAGNYDVCMYFKCGNGKKGSSTVKCVSGTQAYGGAYGWGCCSKLPGTQTDTVKLTPRCTTLGAGSESGTLYIRVRPQSSSQKCGGYKLTWSAKS